MHYLKEELNKFFANIAETQFLLYQVTTHLENYRKIQKEAWKDVDMDSNHMATALVIGDLTGPLKNGCTIHYPTGSFFKMKLSEFDNSFDWLISREGMRSMATCYGILESFLFDIIGAYINNHRDLAPPPKKDHKPFQEKEDAKAFFRRCYRSTNNEKILSFIKGYAPNFANATLVNNEKINLHDWYKVLSNVRHVIVHQNFKVKLEEAKLSREQTNLFNKYFTSRKSGKLIQLQMTRRDIDYQIKMIAEYGFLIFKSFCLEEDLEWKVLMHME